VSVKRDEEKESFSGEPVGDQSVSEGGLETGIYTGMDGKTRIASVMEQIVARYWK
jgi:hypothetical protein